MKYIQHFLRSAATLSRRLSAPAAAVLLLAAGAATLSAAPFDRQIEFRQPDGTVVRVHGKGDEFSAVFRTLDGYTVVHDPALKAYCFATVDSTGHLVSTGVQIHQGDAAALGLARGLTMSAEARKKQVVERYQRWEAGMQTKARWEALKASNRGQKSGGEFIPPPTLGVRVGLTLLVDFSDEVGTVPQAEVISYCNADNYTGFGNNGSIKKYFEENSNGLLTYSNVVTIYIRAPQAKTVYNDTTQDAGQQANTLIKDVIEAMKALPNYDTTILPTFDNLTVDGNNEVIACNVFYAGDNGGVWTMGLWPHSWALYVVGAQELSPGGKKVFRYQITDIGNSLSIGTFCHENGHMLMGYPDLYDYDYDSVGGAGNFCLMGSGGFDKNPVQICAYLKFGSGWATITELDVNSSLMGTVSAPLGPNFNHFYRFLKPGVSTEYYMVENRQRQGRDAAISASGIAVWHIDELGDRDDQNLNYNTTHNNYEVTLMQADNQWHFQRNINAGDPFDLFYQENSSGAYTGLFTDTSTPSARWWDGSLSGIQFADFSSNAPTMTFRIGAGNDLLRVVNYELLDANQNQIIDVNECTDLLISLTNVSGLNVTGIKATVSTTTPGVTLAQRTVQYPNMPPGAVATNILPFKISTAPEFICGTPIDVTLLVIADQTTLTNQFRFPSGVAGAPLRFDNFSQYVIPPGNPNGTNAPVTVSNVAFSISKVVVSAHVTYSFDQRLRLLLTAPDGTTAVLSSNNGSNGRDYGLSCFPDSVRTTFDDDAVLPITAGGPPFVGTYRPEDPLAAFIGKSGTNANGVWTLRAISGSVQDSGVIQCWSLFLTPATCLDGGGECPGADLAIGMVPQPDPVFIGNPLVYAISVTNHGPSSAQNVVVSQVLPGSVTFVSAVSSQGAASQAGGVMTCNLGKLSAGARATVNVTVLPTVPGLIGSSATVTSEQTDFDPQNSTVSLVSRVNPPIADLSVALAGTPNNLVVGGSLTYTVIVTNKGPSSASSVTVTNVLPTSVLFLSGQLSQGTLLFQSNVVICSFGGMTNGQVATATLQVTPAAEGNLVATARVVANQPDPFQANNTATALNSVGPATDLTIGLFDTPDPVVAGSNFTYTIFVTNRGPSAASSVVVNQTLDASLTVQSTASSQGTVSAIGGSVTATLNALPKDAWASITVVVSTSVKKTVISTATVSGGQADPQPANNSAQASTVVDLPFVSIVAAGAVLEFEGFAPANGAVDNGETVTALLSLRNAGNVPNTNLVATLLSTNGVTLTASNTVQTYGQLIPSDLPQARRFSFTASGTNGATVYVPLRLQDGASVSTVTFAFTLPNVRVFSNPNAITIPDSGIASPYPSSISVTGVTGVVGKVTVTLNGLTHTFPEDIDALVSSPNASAKSILMSMAGAPDVANADVTFDDTATAAIPDSSGQILTGSYRPASYYPEVALPLPAPQPAYPVTLGTFKSLAPNGNWLLHIADRAPGDQGNVARGWSLALTLLTPVNKVADVRIAGSASAPSGLADEAVTITYSITNAGPDGATFVGFTNALPATVAIVSATSSQGSLTQNGTLVTGNLGAIAAGGSATVSVVLVPSAAAAGSLQCTALVGAKNETDINLLNNSVTVPVTVVLPEADVFVAQTALPAPVIVGSNLTFQVGITNAGPGKALNTFVTNTLPASVTIVGRTLSVGSSTITGNTIVCNLGTLMPNSGALLQVQAIPQVVGVIANDVRAVTASADPALANNSSQLSVQVNTPAPKIAAAGATLTSESSIPANGTIDPGETVTLELALRNEGSADAANVSATLAATGGVLAPSGSQNYGSLVRGGAAVTRTFSFTADALASSITATLNLQNNGTPLPPVQFQFQFPKVHSYSNTAAIVIPLRGAAQPYPSTIQVAGTTGVVSKVGVTLHGINHSFPRDVNVLLVNPAGASVLLMSHVGGGRGLTNVNLTFSDAAGPLPANSQIVSGTYRPTQRGASVVMPTPAPAEPYGQSMMSLDGTSAEGSWALYVLDDSNGDSGTIVSGWSLVLTTVETVNPVTDLAISMVSSPATVTLGSTLDHTITVNNRGPNESRNVKVRHELPAGVTLVTSSASQGTVGPVSGGVVTWTVGQLPSGATAQAILRVAPTIGLSFISPVSVADDTATDLNLENNLAQTATTVVFVGSSTLAVSIVDGEVHITLTGVAGEMYEIQASGNLTQWQPLTTEQAGPDGVVEYIEPMIPGAGARVYRAVRVVQ